MKKEDQYKIALADYLDLSPDRVSLFWKGRVALYGLLKTIGIQAGDEVILPAFTCVVVPNAIIYLGAKPVYVDIDPSTYNIDVLQIENKITDRTKVILAQNTFGLSCDVDAIMQLANKYDLKVIEDCTHGIGGTYKEKKNGTVAHAAFFSTQWNKPYSTGIGGMAVVKEDSWAKKMLEFEASCAKPGKKDTTMLKTLWYLREKVMFPALYWSAVKSYRYLSKKNVVTGSSGGGELTGTKMPGNYLKRMSSFQCDKGIKGLQTLDKNLKHRELITQQYNSILKKLKKEMPFVPGYARHTFVKYPLLVKDRAAFIKKAEKAAIEIGDWFISPLHPVQQNLEQWNYEAGHFPNAEKCAMHIINLPTHPGVNQKYLKRVLQFIEKNQDDIIRFSEC